VGISAKKCTNLECWDPQGANPDARICNFEPRPAPVVKRLKPQEPTMSPRRDSGFTLIELLIVVAIISIIAAIAVPGLLKARATANEASAIASLKNVTQAQVAYSAGCGNGGYAASFLILGTPLPGQVEAYISPDLGLHAAPQKSGYNFAMSAGASGAGPNDCQARATNAGYYATAVPQNFGTTGGRSFAVNAGNTIWQSMSATPPTEPFTPSPTVSTIQ
jgi:prepilin-type N-terminal cleavage/methylation domain-containing protein